MSENQENVVHEISTTVGVEQRSAENVLETPEMRVRTKLAERHPDWPPIKLKFFFSQHGTAEDMVGMKEYLSEADVYLPEGAHETGKRIKLFQELADADPDKLPPDYMNNVIKREGWEGHETETMARSLYGSKKVVGHIDLRQGDRITSDDFDEVNYRSYMCPTFDETLNAFRKKEEDFNQLIESPS